MREFKTETIAHRRVTHSLSEKKMSDIFEKNLSLRGHSISVLEGGLHVHYHKSAHNPIFEANLFK